MNRQELIEKFCDRFGGGAADFEPQPMTDGERMDELEACILELAEIIGGDGA